MVYIPREIRVGYQNRTGTYTGKLAYVVYVDHTGKLRKEPSWNGWRDKKIESDTFENVPTEGFVFNKRAGGYSTGWDKRQDYVRVYDPRGFEFELTVPNVLYILENANCIKGKGLEGEFVYGWDGSDILLIPVGAPDYEEMISYRDSLYDKTTLKAKDLILGATYRHKNGKNMVYLGRFGAYKVDWKLSLYRGKCHFFYVRDAQYKSEQYVVTSSVSGMITKVVDDSPASDYSDLFSKMEKCEYYSPIDPSRDVLTPFTVEELQKALDASGYGQAYAVIDGEVHKINRSRTWGGFYGSRRDEQCRYQVRKSASSYDTIKEFSSLEQLIAECQPMHKDTYLANGEFYRREF